MSMVTWFNRPDVSKWVRRSTHVLALLPLVFLVYDYASNHLTYNPIQAATQRTGVISVVLLTIMLLCTPLQILTGIRVLTPLRKPLGLYSFLYASLHLLIYVVADFNLAWSEIFREIFQKPYLWLGLIAFIILLLLTITSFNSIINWMGKFWRPLQRLVYPAAVIILIHFFLSLKGNLLLGRGNIVEPAIYSIIILISFLIRVTSIRKQIHVIRNYISFRFTAIQDSIHKTGTTTPKASGFPKDHPLRLHKD